MITIDNVVIEQGHFPDGTLLTKLPHVGDDCVHIKWNYENDAELFTLICARRHYAAQKAILTMPYVPHARQDRVKNTDDVFTLKYFCEVINSLNFEAVLILDPHSNVAPALLNNVANIPVAPFIANALRNCSDNTALFFPDEGAMKRYESYSKNPFAFGIKKRDWATGKILGLNILQAENIVGKDVLIIDDICSRGGTFYHAAQALLVAGAKSVSLYVTHCENTILEGEIFTSGFIKQVYTTHSLVHCDELKDKIIYV